MRPPDHGSALPASDVEVEHRRLEADHQPQPEGEQHLHAARGGDVTEIDRIVPPELAEDFLYLGFGVGVVSAEKDVILNPRKESGKQ